MPRPVYRCESQQQGDGWKPLKKGNLYRRLVDGRTATVFMYRSGEKAGGFGYCIYDDLLGSRFSDSWWETEEEAINAANEDIEGLI